MLNLQAIEADESSVLFGVGCILQRTLSAGDANLVNNHANRQFVGPEIPDIPIRMYLNRLKRYFKCSSSCWVAMLIYLDRMLSISKAHEFPVLLDTLSAHRLIIGAALVAAKFHEDCHYSNEYYAQVGGISLKELNRIELLYCNLLCWDFHIEVATFAKYYSQLILHPKLCAGCQSLQQTEAPVATKESPDTKNVSPKRDRAAFAEIHAEVKHARVRAGTSVSDRIAEISLGKSSGKENFTQAHYNIPVAC